jgi:hypothetical protein
MKLKLEFEYLEKPLSALIEGSWEEIVCVSDIKVEEMLDDSVADQNSKAVLAHLPKEAWIINPIWNPKVGFFGAIRQVPDFRMPENLHSDLQRLQGLFQATYNDDYPPDSGFKSAEEESDFLLEVAKWTSALKSVLGENVEIA